MNYHTEKARADDLSARLEYTTARCQELEYQYLQIQETACALRTDNLMLRQAIEELAECPTLESFDG